MSMRSREEMEQVIREGRGVLFPGGQVVTRVEHLPSAAKLALKDPFGPGDHLAAAEEEVAREEEALAEKKRLLDEARKRVAEATVKAPEKAPAPAKK